MEKLIVEYVKPSGEPIYEPTSEREMIEHIKNCKLPYTFQDGSYLVLGTDGDIIELKIHKVQ